VWSLFVCSNADVILFAYMDITGILMKMQFVK